MGRVNRRGERASLAVTVALLLCVAGIVIYRALAWPITADEALTYNVYLSDGLAGLLHYGANNHVLFSWLAKASISLFGLHEWSLRLPTLVAAAGYLACAGWIAARFFRGFWRPLVAGLLAINPLVMDYLVAARGYGLACALLLVGEALLLADAGRSVESPGNPTQAKWRWRAISICCALAVAANLAFAPAAAALVLAGLWRSAGKRWMQLILPGAFLFAVIMWPYLVRFRGSAIQIGYRSIGYSAISLWDGSLHHDTLADTSLGQVIRRARVPDGAGTLEGAVATAAAAMLLVLCACYCAPKRPRLLTPAATAAMAFCVAVVLIVLLHIIARVPYPVARTALFLLPMGTLAIVLIGYSAGAPLRPTIAALGVLLLAVYARQLNTRCFMYSPYDMGSRKLFLAMAADRQGRFTQPVRLGGTWIFEPSMNFYRTLYHANWLQPMHRDYGHPEPTDYDYFLANPRDYPQLKWNDYRLVEADPISGIWLIAVR